MPTLCITLLLSGLVASIDALAQSAVREVPRPSAPYTPLYSACRVSPPSDPFAQTLFQALSSGKDFAYFSKQLGSLRAKPIESLSAVEAEAYFVILQYMGFAISTQPRTLPQQHESELLEGRTHGSRVIDRYRGDSTVNCAFLDSEVRLLNNYGLKERFGEYERRVARDNYMTFLEKALRGEIRTHMYRDVLQSTVGQYYFEKGLELLPDNAKASELFEIGAQHVFDAASTTKDSRYLADWRRYAFMLGKLSDKQRLEIARRLLTYMETRWAGKFAMTPRSLEVYLHLLDLAGETALAAKSGKDAVSIFSRYLEIVQGMRQRDPNDPNHQVSEAFVFLRVGDAHKVDGKHQAAAEAYERAQRAFESSNVAAKAMLVEQDFSAEIESRQKAFR